MSFFELNRDKTIKRCGIVSADVYIFKSRSIRVDSLDMSRIIQNLVFLKEPPIFDNHLSFFTSSLNQSDISAMAGNMYLNRFCIDEDAAFEVSGIYNLENDPAKTRFVSSYCLPSSKVGYRAQNREAKGK